MATSRRPGPVLVEPGRDAAGSGDAMGSDMDDRPDLMQPEHQHGRDEPGHGDDRRDPPGSPHQPPDRRGHRDERHRDQVSDERSQPGRAFTAGEPGHDDADLDKQQDLKDASCSAEGDVHSPVQGGNQQRVPGKRETGDDDRRGDGAVHARHVTTFGSNWRWAGSAGPWIPVRSCWPDRVICKGPPSAASFLMAGARNAVTQAMGSSWPAPKRSRRWNSTSTSAEPEQAACAYAWQTFRTPKPFPGTLYGSKSTSPPRPRSWPGSLEAGPSAGGRGRPDRAVLCASSD